MRGSDVSEDPRQFVPGSVSPQAAMILRMIGAALSAMPAQAPPDTPEAYDAAAARAAAWAEQIGAIPLAKLAPTLDRWDASGVPVLTVTPQDRDPSAAPLVYIHGGGFVSGSAQSSRLTAALAAASSGRVVHSIDYTLVPRADHRRILDEVVTAWNAIVARADHLPGMFGDSAGGCIAAAAALALRDRGLPGPRALVLLSPMVDLGGEGDTNRTLAAVDYLDRAMLEPALRGYADPADWHHPLVSPLHGDFAPGYPPTLIQVGTREMLLSDGVRFHRALRDAGRSSRMEVFEGMPHVFQPLLAETPEGVSAWADMAAFWREHLA
jgi:acetyl esterase/lipase